MQHEAEFDSRDDAAAWQQPPLGHEGDREHARDGLLAAAPREHRTHRRVPLGAVAVLFQDGTPRGRYLVQNLSAGGALLTGAGEVDDRQPLRVVLSLPPHEPVTVEGVVVRRASAPGGVTVIAVSFRHDSPAVEDAIHDAVLDQLVRADRAARPAVLVVEDDELLRRRLETSLRALGKRVLSAGSPLQAVQLLEDPDENIGTAIVDTYVGETDGVDFVRFLASDYPALRRLLLQARVRPSQVELQRVRSEIHGLLMEPWDEATLREALESRAGT